MNISKQQAAASSVFSALSCITKGIETLPWTYTSPECTCIPSPDQKTARNTQADFSPLSFLVSSEGPPQQTLNSAPLFSGLACTSLSLQPPAFQSRKSLQAENLTHKAHFVCFSPSRDHNVTQGATVLPFLLFGTKKQLLKYVAKPHCYLQ